MNKIIMVCHSLNNNTHTGLVISLCLNASPLLCWVLLHEHSTGDLLRSFVNQI